MRNCRVIGINQRMMNDEFVIRQMPEGKGTIISMLNPCNRENLK
jgi:hypothetical protein